MNDRYLAQRSGEATAAMPSDDMNAAWRKRKKPATETDTETSTETDTQDGSSVAPRLYPHNITLQHSDGALTVDWHTAPNGYAVILGRGPHEILNQPCINPPATLPTEVLPAGNYCVKVNVRAPEQIDPEEEECEPCVVKLATPTQISLTYNATAQRLEVQWQPVMGATGYRVQVVQLVAEATVAAGNHSWSLGKTASSASAYPCVQAWVQAKGDATDYIDSNLGKSAPLTLPVRGRGWGIFDQSDFDCDDYYPEEEEPEDTDEDLVAAGGDTEAEENAPLSLLIPAKAGLGYRLEDGVNPPSTGQIDADGLLVHHVAPTAEGCTIIFADGSEPVTLLFDQTTLPDDEDDPGDFFEETYGLDLLFDSDEAIAEELDDIYDDEDDPPTLSLLIPEKAGIPYTLDDGINQASAGLVDEDGLLVHEVASRATSATLQFADEQETVVLQFVATA